MVSWQTQCGSLIYHRHDETQYGGRPRTTINKVTKKYRFSALRMLRGGRLSGIRDFVTERAKEVDEFVEASVNVADYVERASVRPPIRPERYALDLDLIDLVRR